MFRILFTLAATIFLASPSLGSNLSAPEGPVILTVTGHIAASNAEDRAEFDLEMLEALEKTSFSTSTVWTDGTPTFEGVSLAALVERLGITGGTLKATAINDYTVDIPLTDAVKGGPIIAYRVDGETMSVRDKGPLWIVYPFDSRNDYQSEVIYSRSIWQLDRIKAAE